MNVRVLYVPNESGAWRQLGGRRTFADLERAGLIEAHRVFSLLWRIRAGGDPGQHRETLLRAVGEFEPTIIVMQHMGGTGIDDRFAARLRKASSARLVYHEGDPYSWPLNPLPAEARALGRHADVVYTHGGALFVRNFVRAGAANVRYAQSALDMERFPYRAQTAPGREHDVVVIANRSMPRIRGHPGWRARIAFVEHLQRRLGSRLALYGRGWTGPGVRGPLPYDQQHDAIRSALISANWDHYPREWGYHSDRLPISLAAGSIHATTWHPGFDEVFPEQVRSAMILDDDPVRLVSSIERALDTLDEATASRRVLTGQAHAYGSMPMNNQIVGWLNDVGAGIDAQAAAQAWTSGGWLGDDL